MSRKNMDLQKILEESENLMKVETASMDSVPKTLSKIAEGTKKLTHKTSAQAKAAPIKG